MKKTTKRALGAIMLAVAAAAAQGAAPTAPTEFRIFALGENATTKGTFTLTEESGQAVLEAFAAYGNDLAIDYEHQTFYAPTNGPVPVAGWIPQGGLELRADGLWAVGVRWSDRAKELIAAGEYRYFSPTFLHDEAGTILVLQPLGLVNWPATIGMQPLAAKAVDHRSLGRVALSSFDQIRCALERALAAKLGVPSEMYVVGGPWICDVFDDRVVYSTAGRYYQLAYSMNGSDAVLAGEPVEVERTYAPIVGTGSGHTPTATPGEGAMAKANDSKVARRVKLAVVEDVAKALEAALVAQFGDGCVMRDATDTSVVFDKGDGQLWQVDYAIDAAGAVTFSGEPAQVQASYNAVSGGDTSQVATGARAFRKALKLADGASDTEVLSALERATGAVAEVLKLTGAADAATAFGMLRAWKASHAELPKAHAQLEEQRRAAEDRERGELVAKLKAEGKLTPAEETWAKDPSTDLASLKSFAKVTPRKLGARDEEGTREAPALTKRWEEHTSMELHKIHQENPALYKALKADKEARRAR